MITIARRYKFVVQGIVEAVKLNTLVSNIVNIEAARLPKEERWEVYCETAVDIVNNKEMILEYLLKH